jgi:hypothetical protein
VIAQLERAKRTIKSPQKMVKIPKVRRAVVWIPGLLKGCRVPKRVVAKLKEIGREVNSTKKTQCYQNQI